RTVRPSPEASSADCRSRPAESSGGGDPCAMHEFARHKSSAWRARNRTASKQATWCLSLAEQLPRPRECIVRTAGGVQLQPIEIFEIVLLLRTYNCLIGVGSIGAAAPDTRKPFREVSREEQTLKAHARQSCSFCRC